MTDLVNMLESELSEFDGKALTTLTEIRARHGEAQGFLKALIDLAGHHDANIASGASWLLKDHLEKGGTLNVGATAAYLAVMPELAGWQAQLHACQSLQFLRLEEKAASALLPWLMELTGHQRPFLRAWSLDGLVRLALQHDLYIPAATEALDQAAVDKAASVKARARQLLKLLT